MKTTIMVMDVFVRFRLVAIVQSEQQTQAWEMQVMVIQQVADILISLGFLDSKAAALLTEASNHHHASARHQNDSRFRISSRLTELVYPDSEPVSLEAQQGHALIATGDTTEEALASAGFVLKMDGPLQ